MEGGESGVVLTDSLFVDVVEYLEGTVGWDFDRFRITDVLEKQTSSTSFTKKNSHTNKYFDGRDNVVDSNTATNFLGVLFFVSFL